MKIIIAGSRRFPSLDITQPSDWQNVSKVYEILCEVIQLSEWQIDTVVSGCCWGMDRLGEAWAINNKVPIIYMPANWKKFGKAAGPIRNKEMAEIADALVCIHAPDSCGSMNMIENMKKLGKPFIARKM